MGGDLALELHIQECSCGKFTQHQAPHCAAAIFTKPCYVQGISGPFTRCGCGCTFLPSQLDYIITNKVIHTEWLRQQCHKNGFYTHFVWLQQRHHVKLRQVQPHHVNTFSLLQQKKNVAAAAPCEQTYKSNFVFQYLRIDRLK